MKRAIWIALVTACGKSEPPPVPSAPPDAAPVPAVAPAPPKPVDRCSVAELAKRGTREQPLSVLQRRCSLKGAKDLESTLTKIVGRPLTADESKTVTFEIADRKRFEEIVQCDDKPPRIDFTKLRVWFAVARGERLQQSVWTYDDGKRVTLVLQTTDRRGCFGADDPPVLITNAVTVPVDRTVEVLSCNVPVDCPTTK